MFKTNPSLFVVGVFGLVFGSFFSLVGDRIPRGESIITPRSHCAKCHRPLKFYDLIPLLSYFLLKGKCRYCSCKIPLLDPLIECFTAIGFIIVSFYSSTISEYLVGCGLFSLLMIVTITDLKTMIIPDKIIIAFLCYFLVIRGIYFYPNHFEQDLIGCFYGLSCPLCIWLFNRKGLGLGDVKLFALLGFILGSELILLCIILACIFGMLFYLVGTLKIKLMACRSIIPFAPFIALGAFITYLWGGKFLLFFGRWWG